MDYLYSKQDLASFSQHDLDLLAEYYDVLADNRDDLLWILAISILYSVQHAEMPPDKAWAKYGEQLLKKFATDPSAEKYKETNKLPAEMIAVDPTPTKKYLEWIITSYLDKGIKRFEDMGRVKTALEEYGYLLKKKLITNKFEQNIYAFCGLAGCKQGKRVKEGLDAFLDKYTRELVEMRKVEEHRVAEKDVKKIYDGKDLLIVSPLTQEASCKYGAETKWCTAARGENLFEQYTKDGPLYILIPKKPEHKGEKYQVHIESEQYMDEQDREMEYIELKRRFPEIKNVREFAGLEIREELKMGTFTLENIHFIRVLNLDNITISPMMIERLAEVLKSNSSLKRLEIRDTKTDDAGVKILAKALTINSSLQELALNYNNITSIGAESLAEALKINQSLQVLHLGENKIDDTKSLAEALESNSSLQDLYLDGNKISDMGAVSLAEALESNSSLITLGLSNNRIGDVGARAFATSLESNSSLTTLWLSGNKISDAGAESLAKALESNSSLTTLWLSNNRIGDVGAKSLAKALESNSSLTSLWLINNRIGDVGAKSLAKALESNSSLTTLELSYNNINNTLLQQIQDTMDTR